MFTCCECRGDKYNQTACYFPASKEGDMKVCCEECWEVVKLLPLAGSAAKPGLRQVLFKCYEEGWATASNTFESWLENNGGEEDAAVKLRLYCLDMWKDAYLKVTGEEWS